MPGNRLNSIHRPAVYEGLRERGVPKTRAAKIANAGRAGSRRGGKRSHRRSRRPYPSRGTPADQRLARNRRGQR